MSDKTFLIIALAFAIPYFSMAIMDNMETIDNIGLLKLQIEEKQLKIKQLESGACISE